VWRRGLLVRLAPWTPRLCEGLLVPLPQRAACSCGAEDCLSVWRRALFLLWRGLLVRLPYGVVGLLARVEDCLSERGKKERKKIIPLRLGKIHGREHLMQRGPYRAG